MSTTLDVDNIIRPTGPVLHQHGQEIQPLVRGRTRRGHAGGTGEIGAPMRATGNSAPEDAPAGEEPEGNARELAAVIAGVGAAISLAFLVGAVLRS
jgi:hypothetical protein